MSNVHGLLATGPSDERLEFYLMVRGWLNQIDHRGDSVRYTCMTEYLELAKHAARYADVTLQEIVVTGNANARKIELPEGVTATVADFIEEYPVLYLGTHGMKWEKAEAASE